jgi:hypothetical protein
VGEFWYKGSPAWKDDLAFAASFLSGKLNAVWRNELSPDERSV